MNKFYELVRKNKNYKDINKVEENIFIITDEKKYEKIEFQEIN